MNSQCGFRWFRWLLLGLTLVAGPAGAQTDKISIHGYGGWAVGYSDPHAYLSGSGDGQVNFENASFVLLIEARPMERLRIVFAPEYEIEEGEEETKAELLYAEWQAADRLKVQLGRARLPFGIYADLYDVGTLRPFFDLPQSIYGPTGFVSEFYDGVGLVGDADRGGNWGVQWNAFVGGTSLEIEEPFETVLEAEADSGDESELAEAKLEIIAGGRLLVRTPVEGLTVGFSAFAAKPESTGDFAAGQDGKFGDVSSQALLAEFERARWILRGEIGHHEENEFSTDGGYFEASYRLDDHWQLAGRFETLQVDFPVALPIDARSTLEHDEVSVGVNYWFSSNFVLKASYHRIDGSLFAHPDAEALASGEAIDPRTDLVLFGAQFSF